MQDWPSEMPIRRHDSTLRSPEFAKKHRANQISTTTAVGGVGSNSVDVYSGLKLSLGPLTLSNFEFLASDTGENRIKGPNGEPVIGIVGSNYIRRTSLAIDVRAQTMSIYPPGKVALPTGAKWIPMEAGSDMPRVQGNFLGKYQGRFALDTGSFNTVDFFTPTVKKRNLLEGRATTKIQTTSGASVESLKGRIENLEIGALKASNIPATFQTTTVGGFASPYIDGNIGMRFMEQSVIYFDYQNERMCFVPYQKGLLNSLTSSSPGIIGAGVVAGGGLALAWSRKKKHMN